MRKSVKVSDSFEGNLRATNSIANQTIKIDRYINKEHKRPTLYTDKGMKAFMQSTLNVEGVNDVETFNNAVTRLLNASLKEELAKKEAEFDAMPLLAAQKPKISSAHQAYYSYLQETRSYVKSFQEGEWYKGNITDVLSARETADSTKNDKGAKAKGNTVEMVEAK